MQAPISHSHVCKQCQLLLRLQAIVYCQQKPLLNEIEW